MSAFLSMEGYHRPIVSHAMKFPRSTAWFLRLIAIIQLLTFGLCLVPESSFAFLYGWTGLGHWPHLPFLNYVIRGASYCQGAIGLVLWVMATDINRYRPLVVVMGIVYLVGGPVFYLIHASAGTPHWWALMDTVACFLIGAILLTLCLWPSADPSPSASESAAS